MTTWRDRAMPYVNEYDRACMAATLSKVHAPPLSKTIAAAMEGEYRNAFDEASKVVIDELGNSPECRRIVSTFIGMHHGPST